VLNSSTDSLLDHSEHIFSNICFLPPKLFLLVNVFIANPFSFPGRAVITNVSDLQNDWLLTFYLLFI
jgi:hypothetical protein